MLLKLSQYQKMGEEKKKTFHFEVYYSFWLQSSLIKHIYNFPLVNK